MIAYRGDYKIDFQLEDSAGVVVDVDTIDDMVININQLPLNRSVAQYKYTGGAGYYPIAFTPATDYITIYLNKSDLDNTRLGKIIMDVTTQFVNVNFDDAVQDSRDKEMLFTLRE